MISLLPLQQKLRFDSELTTLLNTAEYELNRFEGAISVFHEKEYISEILKVSEVIWSLQIDGLGPSHNDYYSQLVNTKNTLIENYLSAVRLSTRLLKDISKPSHIIKSIFQELNKNISHEHLSVDGYRTKEHFLTDSQSSNAYIPKTPEEIITLMDNLEKYISSDYSYPLLINAALIHAQFEMIHPFDHYNGLVGRILFQLHLYWKKRITNFSLLLSRELYHQKDEYFERLRLLGKDDSWLDWIKYFLKLIIAASRSSLELIKSIYELKKSSYEIIIKKNIALPNTMSIHEYIFTRPVISVSLLTKDLSIAKQNASPIISKFIIEGFLEEITGKQRNRIFANKKLLQLLNR